jgi:hypothetical protein
MSGQPSRNAPLNCWAKAQHAWTFTLTLGLAVMDIQDFLRLAKQFSDLGDAVSCQLIDVAIGEPIEDQNPNALRACHGLLKELIKHGVDGAQDLQEEILAADRANVT